MKLINTIIITALTTVPLWVSGQKYLEMMNDPKVNFYDVKKEAESYFTEHGKGKGSGYKPYKRWEWINEQRYASTGGNRMLTNVGFSQLKKQINSVSSTTANWSCLGPLNGNDFYGVGRINCIAFDPKDETIVWSGAATGGLWKSTDGGLNWIPKSDFIQNLGISSIAIDQKNTDIIYLGTGDFDGGSSNSLGLLKSTDGGNTWNLTGLTFNYTDWAKITRIIINPDTTSVVIAATTKGVYVTEDAGENWKIVSSVTLTDMHCHPNNPAIIYGCTSKEVYKSVNGGRKFRKSMSGITSGGSVMLMGVTPAAPDFVYVTSLKQGGIQGVYISRNQGETYNKLDTKLVGNDITQLGYNDCMAVSSVDTSVIWFGTVHLNLSKDGGLNFRQVTEWDDPHCDHHYLIYNKEGVLFNGNDGGIWKTADHGENWVKCNAGFTAEQYYKIGMNRYLPDVVLAGSQDNGFHYMKDELWGQGNGGDAMESIVDWNNPKRMMGMGYMGGSLLTSTNGGESWSVVYTGDLGLPADGGNWVTPMAIDPILPNTYYMGLADVYKSVDFGKKWRKISNGQTGGTKLTAIEVYARNSNIIYIAANAKLYKTGNNGTNWSSNLATGIDGSENITSIAISQNNPDEVWITKSGYIEGKKVYCTTDGGISWKNISYNLPNIPFNAIAMQNDSANGVYAGCDEMVFYINKNKVGWEPFNTGLPRAIVNELNVYAPKGLLRAGTYGRGVWQSPMVASAPVNMLNADNWDVLYKGQNNPNAELTASLLDSDVNTAYTSTSAATDTLLILTKNTYSIDGFEFSKPVNISEIEIQVADDSVLKQIQTKVDCSASPAVLCHDIFPTEGVFVMLIFHRINEASPLSLSGIRLSGKLANHPVADFAIPDTVYSANGTVSFTDLSIGNASSWLWEFGDGKSSTDQNPSHLYSKKGKYNVMLMASNNEGMDYKVKPMVLIITSDVEQHSENELTDLVISPNPALESFNIDTRIFNKNQEVTIEIFDLKGALVFKTTFGENGDHSILTETFRDKGDVFIVKATSGAKSFTSKLVLSKYKVHLPDQSKPVDMDD